MGINKHNAKQRKTSYHIESFEAFFWWRLVVLWCIGITHVIFIWHGDILAIYGFGATILVCLFGLKTLFLKGLTYTRFADFKFPSYSILIAAFCIIFGTIFIKGGVIYYKAELVRAYDAGEVLSERQIRIVEQVKQVHSLEGYNQRQQQRAVELQTYGYGSYWDIVKMRISQLTTKYSPNTFWVIACGLFIIGSFLGHKNYIGRAAEYRQQFIRVGLYAVFFGLAFNYTFVYLNVNKPAGGGEYWLWITFLAKTCAGLGFAATYIVLITLGMLSKARKFLVVFAPIGRMALSCYLMQSIIGTTLSYGYGFGLIGEVNNMLQAVYVVTLFALQTLFCRWWLSRYNFGPMEWLWRSLTYWRLQPMRIDKNKHQQISTA